MTTRNHDDTDRAERTADPRTAPEPGPARVNPPTVDLSERKLAELSRLRAVLGFIPQREASPRVVDDRYAIVRSLGAGGMGVVFLAKDLSFSSDDPRAHDRLVALKIIRESYLREVPDAPARLRREANQLARLQGEAHVVDVLAVGGDAGSTYLTMEFIEGTDLREWAAQPGRARTELLEAYLGAARGLHAAHELGIVHRDFKPDNVLIDARGTAKVGDFGIATLAAEARVHEAGRDDPSEPADAPRTTIRGTVAYMAPEQLAGEWPDARSDQFSFCVALWEAIAGELPYSWRSRAAQARALEHPPAGREAVPTWLRRALIRGMSARRGDRFADMGELIEVIERGLARPGKLRRVAMVVGVSLTTGLIGVVLARASGTEPELEPREPCASWVAAVETHWAGPQVAAITERGRLHEVDTRGALRTVERLTASWSSAAAEICEGEHAPAPHHPARRCLDEWLASLDGAVELLASRGDARTLARAPDLLAQLEPPGGDFCARPPRPADPDLADLVQESRDLAALGEHQLAIDRADAAIDRARALATRPHTTGLGLAHAARAEALSFEQKLDEAAAALLEAEVHAIGADDPAVQLHVRVLAAGALAHGRDAAGAARADEHLRRAEPLLATVHEQARVRGEYLQIRALADDALGRDDAAAAGYDAAIAFFERIQSPILATRALQHRAASAIAHGRHDAAIDDLRQAIATLEAEGVPASYPRLLNAELNLALALFERCYADASATEPPCPTDEILDLLARATAHPTDRLRLINLGVAVQIVAEIGTEAHVREFARTTLAALAEAPDLPPAIRDPTAAQVALAQLIRLGDPDAEDRLHALLRRPEPLDPALREAVAATLIDHLVRSDRCAEAEAARAEFAPDAAIEIPCK